MEKFVPYPKLSKKEKRKRDAARRDTWGSLNPVTRRGENAKVYDRTKAQSWKREIPDSVLFYINAAIAIFCLSEYNG